ncbi:MAG: asparaginase [Acidobacteria bacterium]|nr:asparaginase [Acidobacteriota bacterium]
MQAAEGRLISKVGADGVWLCGVLPSEKWPSGLGIALKIADGDDYLSRPVVAVEITATRVLLPNDCGMSPMPSRIEETSLARHSIFVSSNRPGMNELGGDRRSRTGYC